MIICVRVSSNSRKKYENEYVSEVFIFEKDKRRTSTAIVEIKSWRQARVVCSEW